MQKLNFEVKLLRWPPKSFAELDPQIPYYAQNSVGMAPQ